MDIPLPPGLVTSARSPDSERSDESSLKSSEPSSLENSTNSNTTSSLKSSTSSGVYTNASETSSLNQSSNSGVKTSNKSRSSTDLSEIFRSRNSTGSINANVNNPTGKVSAVGRSINQVGENFQKSYTPSFPIDLRNIPLTARIPVNFGHIGDIVKTMLSGPPSANVENYRNFPAYMKPSTNKTAKMQTTDSLMHTTKKSLYTVSTDIPVNQYYRVQNLAVSNDVRADYSGIQFLPHYLLKQPSTVFVYSPNVACIMNRLSNERLRMKSNAVSDKYVVLTASIHKMFSMKEKAETSPNKTMTSNDNTPIEDFKDPGKFL